MWNTDSEAPGGVQGAVTLNVNRNAGNRPARGGVLQPHVLGPITLGAGATSAQRDTQQRPRLLPIRLQQQPQSRQQKTSPDITECPPGRKIIPT